MPRSSPLDLFLWKDVPDEACRIAKEAAGPYQVLQDLIPYLPDIKAKVWYSPDKEAAFFSYPLNVDTDKTASWHIALRQIPGVESVVHGYFSKPPIGESYVRVKEAMDNKTIFGPMSSAMQLKPNQLNNLWGGPNPLASTIAGGLLGAGAGYVGGWLGEQLLPEKYFDKGRLRKLTALAGGAMGAAPGLWWGMDNVRSGRGSLSDLIDSRPWPKQASRYTHVKEALPKTLPSECVELNESWEKYADEAGAAFDLRIPVDQFGRTIWNDLRSQGGYTPAPLAAATTGIVQAASMSQGGATFISPMDIARIGVGMGSGYLSGLVVGKTLGAMAGLRPEAQQKLQETGAWAGMLANTIPLAFRGGF